MNISQAQVDLWRRLFFGRQDAFGCRKAYFDQNEQKQVRRYHPVFKNKESELPSERYWPLSDEWIKRHLEGSEELLIYVLHVDNTVGYAAIDFDSDHTFEDVKRTHDIIRSHGIPCFIARSTKKGYHLYLFFNERTESRLVVAYFLYIYDVCKFDEDALLGRRLAPESFPRNFATPSIGLGMKPALWGAGLPHQNCFVDENNTPIPDQWAFAMQIDKEGRIDAKAFAQLISTHPEISVPLQGGAVRGHAEKKGKWTPPTVGDFRKVIENCPALNAIWAKDNAMVVHDDRVALLAMAKATVNGLDEVRARWPSRETERQIDYAISTDQRPWSCEKMKEHNLCRHECNLERLPPVEKQGGKLVVNPNNLARDNWPMPSPVRFASEKNLGDVALVKQEIERLKTYDGNDRAMQIANLLRNIDKFKPQLKFEIEADLEDSKLFKTKAMLAKFRDQVRAEDNSRKNAELPIRRVAGYELGETPDGYVFYANGADNEKIPNLFTNFTVQLKSDRRVIGLFGGTRHVQGDVIIRDRRYAFTVDLSTFDNPTKFLGAIRQASGVHAVINSAHLDKLKACITEYGQASVETVTTYEDYGMRQDGQRFMYVGGKIIVTKDEIREDHTNYVDLSAHECARGLGLKIVSDKTFRELAAHLVSDVFTCHEPGVIFPVLAHSLQATIHDSFMPLKMRPTLWIYGLTGSGKSFAGQIGQALHGDPSVCSLNARTTGKSAESYMAAFKDSMLLLDDYKAGYMPESQIKGLIQNIYDGKARGRLKSNGQQLAAPRARGLLMVTAEDVPANEASVIARLILVHPEERVHDSPEDAAREAKIKEWMPYYPAFTARFIQYMLSVDRNVLFERFEEVRHRLQEKMRSQQNSVRVAQNLACNYVTFAYLCDFLAAHQIISSEQHAKFLMEHERTMHVLQEQLIEACHAEQASNVFCHALRELLVTGRYYVTGIGDEPRPGATKLGFAERDKDGKLTAVCLLKDASVKAVKELMSGKNGEGISHTTAAIGNQLRQDNVLVGSYKGRSTVNRRHNGQLHQVWQCDPVKLGIAERPEDVHEVAKALGVDVDEVAVIGGKHEAEAR